MTIEINYLTVLLAAAVLSAIGSLLWAAGRSLLNQYGALLRDQLADHRADIGARQEADRRRLDQFESAIDAYAGRVARLEHDMRTAPTHDDLKRLHARIDGVVKELHDVAGDLKALNQKVEGIGRTLGLIHEFMLTGGSSK
ncbi:hypothetical protein ACNQFN_11455 [Thauera butanivorans]|uniref:hypothetical protein n=1 Tax=Thauera butanivorans TaxID=86174 RepID=UPI003AB693AF